VKRGGGHATRIQVRDTGESKKNGHQKKKKTAVDITTESFGSKKKRGCPVKTKNPKKKKKKEKSLCSKEEIWQKPKAGE